MFARSSLQLQYKLKIHPCFHPLSLPTLVSTCTGAKTDQRQNGSAPNSRRQKDSTKKYPHPLLRLSHPIPQNTEGWEGCKLR